MEALGPMVTRIFELGAETSEEHCFSYGRKSEVDEPPSDYDVLLNNLEEVLDRVSVVAGNKLYPIFIKLVEEFIKSGSWKKR